MRLVLILTLLVAGWGVDLAAQTGPTSQPVLLDALGELWVKLGRQPKPEEIDTNGLFKSTKYLREWQTWDGVRTALADHLYQKGLTAAIQGDATKASEFYRQCLVVSPGHSDARAGLSRALLANVDNAANHPAEFTVDQAGAPGSDAYDAFVAAYRAGRREEAIIHYQRANREKTAYVTAEKQRLIALYDTGVTLFQQKNYGKARGRFTALQAIKPAQAGYEEICKPRATEIDGYLQQINTLIVGEQARAIEQFVVSSPRFQVWISAAYYALSSDIGFRTITPAFTGGAHPKVTNGAFFGGDIEFGVNLTQKFTVGLITSLAMNAPNAKIIISVGQCGCSRPTPSTDGESAVLVSMVNRV